MSLPAGTSRIVVNMEGVAATAGNGGNAVNELSLPELYAELSKTGQTPKNTQFVCGTAPSTHTQNELREWLRVQRYATVLGGYITCIHTIHTYMNTQMHINE